MKKRSAIKSDLFAPQLRKGQIDHLGDPLAGIEACIDFKALASAVDQAAPREEGLKGGRPAYLTETMVRILVLKHLNNHSDERMDLLLLDRLSYQRFCGLTQSLKIPDRTTIWSVENCIGEAGAMAFFEGVSEQLLKNGFIAKGGKVVRTIGQARANFAMTMMAVMLQHEAAGLFPQNGDCGLLAPGIRLVTERIGHQGEIREKSDQKWP